MTESRIRLDTNTIQKMALFESITKASLRDCIESDDEVIFVVGPGNYRKALGKNGSNAKALQRRFNKNVWFVEFSSNPVQFARNMLKPIPIKSVEFDNKLLNITIKANQRAFPSKKVKKVKMLLKRYFPTIEKVSVKV